MMFSGLRETTWRYFLPEIAVEISMRASDMVGIGWRGVSSMSDIIVHLLGVAMVGRQVLRFKGVVYY
jgi:hypothetical protein